jgi:competence ComEA-like helix-hairpin-helix protein
MRKKREKIFLLTGEQWLGVLTLGVFALGTIFAIKYLQPKEESTIAVSDSVKTAFEQYQTQRDKKYQRDTIEIRLHEFNPNTADSSTLVHLGFQPWQAKNMLKYRAKGGKYRKAEDLKRLYGMTDSMYNALEPYIRIPQDAFPTDKKQKHDTIEIRLHEFDPNTADSSTLVHLGFKPWQAKNMLKYRSKGGKYRKKEDLKKLYGMTDSMYLALEPYISITRDTSRIDTSRIDTSRTDTTNIDSLSTDTLPKWKNHKKDTILNLRTADTTELKMIRGIGSYRAKMIVRYREQLGGYISIDQIMEAKGMEKAIADSILPHFIIDSVVVVKMPVNKMRLEGLQRHPYLSFEQAKAIYEYRRKHIRINSKEELLKIKELSSTDIEKISHYMDFSQ